MRVMVTGAGGQLGRDLLDACAGRIPVGGRRRSLLSLAGTTTGSSLEVVGLDHAALAVEDRGEVLAACEGLRPDVVLHAAAFTAVDVCESEVDKAFSVNAFGTRNVAEGARRVGAHLVYVSTDYVFDGTAPDAYHEWDRPNPQSVYGKSKYAGEAECGESATIVRTSWVCGFHGANMVKTVLRLAAGDGVLRFVEDQRGAPTFTADLAAALLTLGLDRHPGIFHVTNAGETTWYGFARRILEATGGDPERVVAIATADLDPPRPAPRPANSVLANTALRNSGLPALPGWEDGLDRLLASLVPERGSKAA